MNYIKTTQVPNALFDVLLKDISPSELRILLVVIRLTNGWIDKRTGKRKQRARITHSLFMKMTGLSRRSVSSAVQSLITKGYIEVSDHNRIPLSPEMRRGKEILYFRSLLSLRPKSYGGGGMKRLSDLIHSTLR